MHLILLLCMPATRRRPEQNGCRCYATGRVPPPWRCNTKGRAPLLLLHTYMAHPTEKIHTHYNDLLLASTEEHGDREADVVLDYPRLNVSEGIQTSLGAATTRGEEAPLLHPCNRTHVTEQHDALDRSTSRSRETPAIYKPSLARRKEGGKMPHLGKEGKNPPRLKE